VAFSPDETRLLMLTDAPITFGIPIRTLRAFSAADGREVAVLGRYSERVNRLEFSPDGSKVAVVLLSATKILDAATGREIATLENSADLSRGAFSPDGSSFAAGGSGGVRCWNIANGRERWQSLSGQRAALVTFSPDATVVVAAMADSTLQVANSVSGQPLARLTGGVGPVSQLSFGPGKTFITAGSDGSLRVWNVPLPAAQHLLNADRTAFVDWGSISRDGRSLLVQGRDSIQGLLNIYNLSTGRLELQRGYPNGLAGRPFFSPDGARVAGGRCAATGSCNGPRSDLQRPGTEFSARARDRGVHRAGAPAEC
jgi:WD40 repeat protein